MNPKFCWLFLASSFLVEISFAQEEPYRPLRIAENLTLDGKLDEPEWQQTPMENDFMQTDPHPGDTATQETEVRIVYNDEYLYVGLRCYDDPSKLIQVHLERDFNLGDDDGTVVTIDTYHDKNTGVSFGTNTLGARWDAQILNDGNDQFDSYNTFWDVAVHIDSLGYCTEFRIPWSSIRFESKPEVIMGIRIARLVRRTFELSTWPRLDPSLSNGWDNISFARKIVFENLKARKPFYLIPYAIANYSMENVLTENGETYQKKTEFMVRKHFVQDEALDKILSNIGADAKYGLTKNLTLDLTVNTDFAQAEVDDRIINLSKYEVNLPEKRNFFLESANNLSYGFPSGNEVFISRSIGNENGVIVPIIAGARMTGKMAGWQLGVLDMQTKGISENEIAPHNFFVARTRKDIDHLGSFIGGILTNRINTDSSGLSNQSFGVDFVKKFNLHLSLEGGLVGTAVNADLKPLGQSLYSHVGIFRNANQGFTYSGFVDLVGKDFNPVIGYLDESDHGLVSTGFGYSYQPGTKSKAEFLYVNTNESYRWKLSSGDRETVYFGFFPGVTFKSQANINFSIAEYKIDSLTSDWHLDDRNAISSGTYKMFANSINIQAPQKSRYNASFSASYGGFYGGKGLYISPFVSYSFTKHFSVGITYEYNRIKFSKYLDTDSSTLYQTNLIRLNIAYIFSTKFSLKLYTQYDDLSNSISSNLRFRYNPREGTDLYIVINQGLNTDLNRLDPHLPRVSNQEITVKFIKTFSL